jgi:acylphosphatase
MGGTVPLEGNRKMNTITINNFEMAASLMGFSADSYYVTATEAAKVARKILKSLGIKGSVRKRSSGTIDITVEKSHVEIVNKATAWLEGVSFDGMTDYEGIKTLSYNGKKVYLGSRYIFVTAAI